MVKPIGFDESWLKPGGVVPVDVQTTYELVREIQRLRALPCEHTERNGIFKDGKYEEWCRDCGKQTDNSLFAPRPEARKCKKCDYPNCYCAPTAAPDMAAPHKEKS